MKNLSALLCGVLFGFGLALSGMTDTQKVIGFLNIFVQWDPDLIFVMGGAVIVSAIGFFVVFKCKKTPLFDQQFFLPVSKVIDKPLVIGAVLFGVGWGLYGYCPGPAIASVINLSPVTLLFIATMVVGLFLGDFVSKKLK